MPPKDIDYLRPALNCSFTWDGDAERANVYCAACGSPMYLHAEPGKSLSELGFIHGEHRAWRVVRGLPPVRPPQRE